jgi:UrcA family protein
MLKIAMPACILLAALAAPAGAQDARSVPVAYADLDLTKPEGIQALDHRIAAAVRAVCFEQEDALFANRIAIAECRRVARRDAADQRVRAIAAAQPTMLAAAR